VENQLRKIIREKIELDIEVGDELLGGRFKNKKVIVKDIGKDEKNQPTINGKALLKFRIKKLIKEEIDKLFEILGFQSSAAEQMATNMALYKLPRRGMDSSINNYSQVQWLLDKEASEEEREEELKDKFKSPSFNTPNATVSTNIFEDVTNPMAAQKNLDWERLPEPKNANFNKDAQEEFDLHNDNINRELNKIPPGNSQKDGVSNNKSKNF
jgi:hypothetical protein